MVLAIEPMVTMGGPDVRILDDGWTAVTQDGSLAAHFEHTIAVTEDGPDVLTSKGASTAPFEASPRIAAAKPPLERGDAARGAGPQPGRR
jgi:hypothetical protein